MNIVEVYKEVVYCQMLMVSYKHVLCLIKKLNEKKSTKGASFFFVEMFTIYFELTLKKSSIHIMPY